MVILKIFFIYFCFDGITDRPPFFLKWVPSLPAPTQTPRVFCSPPRGRTIRSIWTLGLEEDDIADLNLRISNSSSAATFLNFSHCSTFSLLVSAGYRSLVVEVTIILSFVFTFISGFVGSPSPVWKIKSREYPCINSNFNILLFPLHICIYYV